MQLLKHFFIKLIFGKAEDGSWRYCSSLIQAHLGIILRTFAIACCAITWERKKKKVGSGWKVIYLATEEGKENNSAQLKLFPEEAAESANVLDTDFPKRLQRNSGKAWQGQESISATDFTESCKWKQMSLMFMEKWQITIYSMADGWHRLHQVDI